MGRCLYDPDTGIYTGPVPTTDLPSEKELDFVTYLFAGKAEIKEYSSKKVLIDAETDEFLTLAELREKLQRVAVGLASLGVKQGDVVAILLSNTVYYPIILMAITSLGAIAMTMNPLRPASEIGVQVGMVGAKFAFTAMSNGEKLTGLGLQALVICGECEGLETKLDDGPQVVLFSKLLNSEMRELPTCRIRQTDTAALMFSSGTTGLSKVVVVTHRMLIANLATTAYFDVAARPYGSPPAEQNVSIIPIPICHVFGMLMLIGSLFLRCQAILLNQFDFSKMLDAVHKYRATHMPLHPLMIQALAEKRIAEKYDLSSIISVSVGGGALSEDTAEAFRKRFPHSSLSQGYGMTEVGFIASTMIEEPGRHCPAGSVGYLVTNIVAKIADVSSGTALPPSEAGELLLGGPQCTPGYLSNPEDTSALLDGEGWLHTGDLAYFDLDGYLFIVDRIKELIKYKTHQISPAKLENVLRMHPEIREAAVVAIPDQGEGELPVAWAVRTANSKVTESEVLTFVAKQVAPFEKLRRVLWIDAIPTGATGKIQKRLLSARAAADLQENLDAVVGSS